MVEDQREPGRVTIEPTLGCRARTQQTLEAKPHGQQPGDPKAIAVDESQGTPHPRPNARALRPRKEGAHRIIGANRPRENTLERAVRQRRARGTGDVNLHASAFFKRRSSSRSNGTSVAVTLPSMRSSVAPRNPVHRRRQYASKSHTGSGTAPS